MTIHHDKMAYGKLESLSEKFSDDKLAKMAQLLSQNNQSEKEEASEKNNGTAAEKKSADGHKKQNK